MLTTKLAAFYAAVDDARANVGDSPTRIADIIIADAFPSTHEASFYEGCDGMFRRGVVEAIKTYVTKPPADKRNGHFNDIAEDLMPLVEPLAKAAYLVPTPDGDDMDPDTRAIGFYMPIAELVRDLPSLIAARDHLATKRDQIGAEVAKLDRIIAHLEIRAA